MERIETTMRDALADFLGLLANKARSGELNAEDAAAIPDGTTGTLPVRFTLNGNTRNLTFFGGANVTAADLVGAGVIEVWYDWFNGIFQLVSPLAPATP